MAEALGIYKTVPLVRRQVVVAPGDPELEFLRCPLDLFVVVRHVSLQKVLDLLYRLAAHANDKRIQATISVTLST